MANLGSKAGSSGKLGEPGVLVFLPNQSEQATVLGSLRLSLATQVHRLTIYLECSPGDWCDTSR